MKKPYKDLEKLKNFFLNNTISDCVKLYKKYPETIKNNKINKDLTKLYKNGLPLEMLYFLYRITKIINEVTKK